jgi:hypothetical protein
LDGSQGPIGPAGPAGPAGPGGASLRAQHNWNGSYKFLSGYTWETIPASVTAFVSEGGPLLINIDVSVKTAVPQTYNCRPIVDGAWAGLYGGYTSAAQWTEGAMTTPGENRWMMWSKSRVYIGIPAGTHQVAVQCFRESALVEGFVGHDIIPGSLSVLEMSDGR